MRAEVDEATGGLEDANRLSNHGYEVLHVRMREGREDDSKRAVLERQRSRVGAEDIGEVAGALARDPELVLGEVDAGYRPSELVERRKVEARAATEVEAAAGARPDQPAHGIDDLRPGGEMLVVPGGDAVVE